MDGDHFDELAVDRFCILLMPHGYQSKGMVAVGALG